ncbi:copper homeostasis membrane protein CopD [Sphingomonas sp. 22176]|uniref:copper homeostasis membrane protein CopD n=1 Tax=Sphingomonas sp. 22176 TaxID=3453884 RepID=UPI003F83ECAF
MEADWPLISVRLALYLALGGLFGLSAFHCYGLPDGDRDQVSALRPWLAGLGVAGLLLSCIAIVLLAAAMAGMPTWPIDYDALAMLLSDPAIGAAWKIRMAALAFVSLAAWRAPASLAARCSVAIAAGVALVTLAWTGHGAMDAGTAGWVHLLADAIHLLAAGAWLGALVALARMVTRPADRLGQHHLRHTHRALDRFSLAGTIFVAAILVSGIVNAWLLVGPGNLTRLVTTLYGQLLLAKLALFAGMLALASLNRFRLTPAFDRAIATSGPGAAVAALRRSLAVETGCAVAIFALVAWLGTLAPPISAG